MSESEDEAPIDLQLLVRDLDQRAERVATHVATRVSLSHARDVRSLIGARLERAAIPALLAAAAAVAAVAWPTAERTPPDPFAALVIHTGPARGWVVSGRAPDLSEVAAMIADGGAR